MKEIIIKYKDSRILELLKSLARHFDFSISEKKEEAISSNQTNQTSESKAVDFVNQWAGFLKNTDADNSRYNYLVEKYK